MGYTFGLNTNTHFRLNMNSPWNNDYNDIFLQIKKFLDSRFKRKIPTSVIGGLLLALTLIVWLLSGIYEIKEGSQGVVLRFGKFACIRGPGLNYHLPQPFERVIIEKTAYSRRLELGYRSNLNASEYIPSESNILTKDENIVCLKTDITW